MNVKQKSIQMLRDEWEKQSRILVEMSSELSLSEGNMELELAEIEP